jgi:simple sugar transport system permease protein
MTATTAANPVVGTETGYWTRDRKFGVAFIVVGLLAVLFWGILAKGDAAATFSLGSSVENPIVKIPIPPRIGVILLGIIAIACGAALVSAKASKRANTWLTGIAILAIVLAFLCWQVSGHSMPLGTLANSTLFVAVPLIFGALAGVIGERSGVINVAIEGQLLMGAFLGALIGSLAGSVWAGLVAAAAGGVLVAALLSWLAIRYLVDQVVLGVVLNLLVLGLTSFLYTQLMQKDSAKYNNSPKLGVWEIPGLHRIPIIGPALFAQNVLGYIMILLVIAVHVGLFHTRWGLRTRAVGEHPTAADTVGIKVLRTRYRNMMIAGVIAGLGGAFITLGSGFDFSKNMTVGKGFIALAALIFGRWSPVGATLAALLFGFTSYLGDYLSTIGSSIPSQFLAMLPYAVTIFAVAGLVGRVRAPAADGKPYVKG